jgi:hypothetical protein
VSRKSKLHPPTEAEEDLEAEEEDPELAQKIDDLLLEKDDPEAGLRIRIGSGFNRVSGSGSGFGIRIRIQEGKNDPCSCSCSCFTVLDGLF